MPDNDERSIQERVAAWANRPDAILMNSGPDVSSFVRPFTAAIIVPGKPSELGKSTGSGVFVALGDRRFILTAGHVIEETRGEALIIPYSQVPRTTTWDLPRRGCITRDGLDVGYIELPIREWRILEAEGKVFMSARRLHVERAATLVDDDHYVVAGFPRALSNKDQPGTEMMRFHLLATSAAGRRKAAPSARPVAPGVEVLDLAIDGRVPTTDLMTNDHTPVTLPDLAGMSGGPCWKGFVQPNPSAWTSGGMKVVGTYVARVEASVDLDPGQWRFARSMLVGHHLRLIARDYADLAPFIWETFPDLAEWSQPPL